MEKDITCIVCPVGCPIKVTGNKKQIISIIGYTCDRGKSYANSEFLDPRRILTTVAKVSGADEPLISVRSDRALPYEMIIPCVREISKLTVSKPIVVGQVLIQNIMGTDVNIIASVSIK